MSLATWLFDIALWSVMVILAWVTILDLLNYRGDE